MPDGLGQRVAAEGIAELLRHHHLEDRGLARRLVLDRGTQRGSDVFQTLDRHALATKGTPHRSPARVVEVHALEATGIEVHVILFLCAPLAVVEDHRRDADPLAYAGQHLVEADTPGAIADIRDRGTRGCSDLRAADHREGIAAVTEAHRSEHRSGTVETQIRVGHRTDVADVGGDHRIRRHRPLELAQHLARMHVARVAGDLGRERIAFLRPSGKLGLPGLFLCADPRDASELIGLTGEAA